MDLFAGFQPRDFIGIAGTTWRGRQNPAGLARPLTARMRADSRFRLDYDSWSMGRFPSLNVAARDFYSYADSPRAAKFNVWLTEDGARFGLWVEKIPPDAGGPPHWRNVLGALQENDDLRAVLMEVMRENELHLWIGHAGTTWAPAGEQLGRLPALGERVAWPEMLEGLRSVPDERWSCFSVRRHIPAERAMGLAGEVSAVIAGAFLALEPLYVLSVSPPAG
jgi:hypothetical protein